MKDGKRVDEVVPVRCETVSEALVKNRRSKPICRFAGWNVARAPSFQDHGCELLAAAESLDLFQSLGFDSSNKERITRTC